MALMARLSSKLGKLSRNLVKWSETSLPTLECASFNHCASESRPDLLLGSILINFVYFRFLDGEMRTITKEKGILESKRLDLDSCKSRVRKARSMIGQQSVSTNFHVEVTCKRMFRAIDFRIDCFPVSSSEVLHL